MAIKIESGLPALFLKFSLFFFFIVFGILFVTWPPISDLSDSDLFFHINGGKYLFKNFTIPDNSFFSFILPEISWGNYYWLFQGIVYWVYKTAGFYGIAIMRALVFLLTIGVVQLFFLDGYSKRSPQDRCIAIACFCLVVFSIYPRALAVVRPHMFSYFFIVIFLYIIEYKRTFFWVLPICSILWANIHGMEYPVWFLIVGAILAEQVILGIFKKNRPNPLSKTQRSILISLFYCLFLTPLGIELFKLPFSHSPFLNQIVNEMMPFSMTRFFEISFLTLNGFWSFVQSLVILISLASVLILLTRKKLHLYHLFLFSGGLLLLLKGQRFIYEAILLSIPVLNAGVDEFCSQQKKSSTAKSFGILFFPLIVLPAVILFSHSNMRPAFPISFTSVPAGIVTFLNHLNVGGRVFNYHNEGGYYQFGLSSKYKIFLDLELSIFSDTDLFISSNALTNQEIFDQFIKKYDPDFVTAPLNLLVYNKFLLKNTETKPNDFEQFVPVFFDDKEMLYVNKLHFPEIANNYEIKKAFPKKLVDLDYDIISKEERQALSLELEKINKIYPKGLSVSFVLCNFALQKKQPDRAMEFAKNAILDHPAAYLGYSMKGQTFMALDAYQNAIVFFKKALKKQNGFMDKKVLNNLYQAYLKNNDHKNAYRILKKTVNIFAYETSPEDLYNLGVLAITLKEGEKADTYLKMARLKSGKKDVGLNHKIDELIKLRNQPLDN